MTQTLLRYLNEHPVQLNAAIGLSTLVILALTLIPSAANVSIRGLDKVAHFLLMGGWTLLIGLQRIISGNGRANLKLILFLGIAFGGAIELLQYLMPFSRSAELWDFVADAAGCLAALPVLTWLQKNYLKDNSSH